MRKLLSDNDGINIFLMETHVAAELKAWGQCDFTIEATEAPEAVHQHSKETALKCDMMHSMVLQYMLYVSLYIITATILRFKTKCIIFHMLNTNTRYL